MSTALEAYARSLLIRARFFEAAVHDSGPWHAAVLGGISCDFPLERTVLADECRILFTGYVDEIDGLDVQVIEIYCRDRSLFITPTPPLISPCRIALELVPGEEERAA